MFVFSFFRGEHAAADRIVSVNDGMLGLDGLSNAMAIEDLYSGLKVACPMLDNTGESTANATNHVMDDHTHINMYPF